MMETFDNKPMYDLETVFPAAPVTSESFLYLNKPMVPGAVNCAQNLSLVFKMIL